eukprot:CAMPEP_0179635002 /NCGR_PEP_ID=MMETSP0932-20121108/8338_1 /TAXON_ID=548131 ORGANISM="Ostreococcus mediterraneus, Strain clade-D-RCC2596" /NCGR_SAMPLE_ID=MMETSP0932 /ASSEMBLY_ACC=CAM_ASM_000582 /LENGTH=150 /DNA_ID=CAMNT_0021504779 /DNA_START=42 /DNA_END=494 /DNA_ORIENTATION=+
MCATHMKGVSVTTTRKTSLVASRRASVVTRAGAKPRVLSKAEELRLLGKAVAAAESFGLISLVEKSGVSLSTVEKLGLLSKGEEIIYDRRSPGNIAAAGYALALAGAGVVYALPDDSAASVAAQLVIAGACAVGFGLAQTASSTLSTLQK